MSDDLISREKTRNEILLLMKDMKLTSGDTTVWQDCIISPTEAANTLRWMPSVDAVEVVRCRDCKYARMTYAGECKYCDIWFPDEAVYIDGDSFCSAAERREE